MLSWFFRPPRRGASREISEEVDEEFAAHREMLARDLELQGWKVDAAEHEAQRRFGDLATHRRMCIELRAAATPHERAMMYFGFAGILGILFGATCLFLVLQRPSDANAATAIVPEGPFGPPPEFVPAEAAAALADARERLAALSSKTNAAEAILAAEVVLRLPPRQVVEHARLVHERFHAADARRAFLERLVAEPGQEHVAELLDLGMNDVDPGVRSWALVAVAGYALRDFSTDADGYRAWFAEHRASSRRELVDAAVDGYFQHLMTASGEQLRAALELLGAVTPERFAAKHDDLAALLRDQGAWTLVAGWVESGDLDVRIAALEWAERLGPDEALGRDVVRPALVGGRRWDERTFGALCRLHAACGDPRRLDDLEQLARERAPHAALVMKTDSRPLRLAVGAMARTEDPRALRAVLGLLALRDDAGMCALVGEALTELTNVPPDPTHDFDWWRAWWNANEPQLPSACRDAGFPERR